VKWRLNSRKGDEEMVRSVASKVVWVGRATLFLVGLAVVLAVVLGLASAALAGTGVGDAFNLGRINTVNRISQLVGSTDNPMLRITNNNTGTDATALTLQVEPGLTPMKVNSSTQVSNLNADLVDGRSASSFVANSTYRLGQGEERAGTPLSDGSKVLSRSCLAGDRLLSGGPASVNVNSDVLDSFAQDTNTWQARINDSAVSGGDSFTVVILCADQ
jgi:hypothetical protein